MHTNSPVNPVDASTLNMTITKPAYAIVPSQTLYKQIRRRDSNNRRDTSGTLSKTGQMR